MSSVPRGGAVDTSSVPTADAVETSSDPKGDALEMSSVPRGVAVETSSIPKGGAVETSSVPGGAAGAVSDLTVHPLSDLTMHPLSDVAVHLLGASERCIIAGVPWPLRHWPRLGPALLSVLPPVRPALGLGVPKASTPPSALLFSPA